MFFGCALDMIINKLEGKRPFELISKLIRKNSRQSSLYILFKQ